MEDKELIELVKELNAKIDSLEQKINDNNKVLVNHINFVERIYETIKRPFMYIIDRTNKIMTLQQNSSSLEY